MGTFRSSICVFFSSACFVSAFVGRPSIITVGIHNSRCAQAVDLSFLSELATRSVIVARASIATPAEATAAEAAGRIPPSFGPRNWRRCTPRLPLRTQLRSSRTVDVDVIDVTDVTEEEARKREKQEEANSAVNKRFTQKPPADVAKEVRGLLDEALNILRETGPQVVSGRGLSASRAVLLTLRDIAQDWRSGKLLRSRSGGDSAAARQPTDAAAKTAGMGLGGIGSVFAAILPGQELDPAKTARTLRLLFERLGTTYIKLGQFIASSPSLFPAEYVMEFQTCLDATQPVPYSKIIKIVKEELGGETRVSEEFQYIDPKPLASASVAQVHRAKLRTGEDVVLKVRKPGVKETLQADLGFLYVASKLLEILQPNLGRASFAAIVSDIRTAMLDELDFRKEAKNIKDFTDFLEVEGITDAAAPKVYENLSSKRLLVMERFKGVPLTDLDNIRSYSNNPEATLITALNTWSKSVMMADSFHADVHAGNLLVLEDGRVGFIDFGIVGRIPERVWSSFGGISNGFISKNYRMVAKSLVRMGAADGEVDIGAFAVDIGRVLERFESMEEELANNAVIEEETGQVTYRTSVNTDQQAITRLLLDIFEVAENNGLKLPREFGLLVKQALYFDRYTRLLAPDLDPLRDERVTLVNTDGRTNAIAR